MLSIYKLQRERGTTAKGNNLPLHLKRI